MEKYRAIIGDHGWVELYDVYPNITGELDDEVVAAARASYKGGLKSPDENDRLLRYLIKNWHDTPLEMVDVQFTVNAPVIVWWQWLRHRMASYNLQSLRYTEAEQNKILIPRPDEWRSQDTINKQGSAGMIDPDEGRLFTEAMEGLTDTAFMIYEQMIEAGVAREQARLVLPGFAVFYQGRTKANLRSWLNFITLRNEARAQSEIRQYASAIETILHHLAPQTLKYWREFRTGPHHQFDGSSG